MITFSFLPLWMPYLGPHFTVSFVVVYITSSWWNQLAPEYPCLHQHGFAGGRECSNKSMALSGVVMHGCDPCTRRAEKRGFLWIWNLSGLCHKFPASPPAPWKHNPPLPQILDFASKQPGVIIKSALCSPLSASVPLAWFFEYFMGLRNGCWSSGGDCGCTRQQRAGVLVLLCSPIPIPLILPTLESLREMEMTASSCSFEPHSQ